MTADLIYDDRAWEYPGGVCRLLVWQQEEPDPDEIYTVALVSHDESSGGSASLTDAMSDVIAILDVIYIGLSVGQHTLSALRHEFQAVYFTGDGLRWSDISADDVAQDVLDWLGY